MYELPEPAGERYWKKIHSADEMRSIFVTALEREATGGARKASLLWSVDITGVSPSGKIGVDDVGGT
jgi:hypothetical protein